MPNETSKRNELRVAVETVGQRIFLIRGEKVMLSTDLAELYGVEPRALVQAVKRNRGHFPDDFMFQLSCDEFQNLKSQIVTSGWGGLRRAAPYAFTEEGVAMLSSVLRCRRAVQVNIAKVTSGRGAATPPFLTTPRPSLRIEV